MDINKKITLWKNKLLDTNKKNRLINYTDSATSSVCIISFEKQEIINDILNKGNYNFQSLFKVLPNKKLNMSDIEDVKKAYAELEMIKPLKTVKYLYTTSDEKTLNLALYNLDKKSSLLSEETGVNSLFISYGIVRYKNKSDESICNAPLFLIPVKLERKTFKDRYKLCLLDDDYFVNETLAYKFNSDYKIDINIIDESLTFEENFNKLKELLISNDFLVLDDMYLSLFSFSKMKMYKDLEENKKLLKDNELIKCLCDQENNVNENFEGCKKVDFLDKFLVLKADESQIEAVNHALNGDSFVLQGPPGTGKSQTITNIIASLIAKKKKVLFISEKKAALEVVYKNLQKVGLSDFALALHDTKTNKKDVVKDLESQLSKISEKRIQINNNIEDLFSLFSGKKIYLDNYSQAIMKKRGNLNITFYELAEILTSLSDVSNYDFSIVDFFKYDKTKLNEVINLINVHKNNTLSLECQVLDHPFYSFKLLDFEYKDQARLVNIIYNINNDIIEFEELFNQLSSIIDLDIFNIGELNQLISYFNLLSKYIDIPLEYYEYNIDDSYLSKLEEVKNLYVQLFAIKDVINEKYKSEFYNLDAVKMLESLKGECRGLFKVFNKKYKSIKEEIKKTNKENKKVSYNNMISDLELLLSHNEYDSNTKKIEEEFNSLFASHYNNENTDFNRLENIIKYIIEYGRNYQDVKEIFTHDYLLKEFKDNKELLNEFKEVISNINLNLANYNKSYQSYSEFFFDDINSFELNKIIKLNEGRINNINKIFTYVSYLKTLDQITLISPEYADLIIVENIKPEEYLDIFLKRFYTLFTNKVIKSDKILDEFNQFNMNTSIEDFVYANKSILEINKYLIHNNITSTWPNLFGIMNQNLEVKVILSEAAKKRKIKPLRQLFKEIPNILCDMKPLFMMSPLSCATFIDPTIYEFDTVIFDEASQLTTENAVGAIYRSKQLIVVGDTKQLPPTSFFNSEIVDEDDDTYDIYDSILTEAETVLPKIMLKWHYRSVVEGLINFSNTHIYNDLVTIPSNINDISNYGVSYLYVDCDTLNKDESQLLEATRVCELVYNHMKNKPNKSLGIVTFNITHQLLIEEMINSYRRKDEEFDRFLNSFTEEKFFVKNIETVQGDERDSIIISIGYAKDYKKKLSMNFGPLNQNGGYKRLNVMITRAKEQVVLVGSILPSDFDSAKTNAKGVLLLRDYISYAQNQFNSQLVENNTTDKVILSLKEELLLKGYKSSSNVGASDFKIDLAIMDKDDNYVVAVMIDNPRYHQIESTIERNYLRSDSLKNRGWIVYNLWISNYLVDKETQINNIISLIDNKVTKTEELSNLDLIDSIVSYEQNVEIDIENLFKVYPNTTTLIDNITSKYKTKDKCLTEIISMLSPVNIDVLKRILLPVYGQTRLTPTNSNIILEDINRLIEKQLFYKITSFLLKPSDLVKIEFRRHEEGHSHPRSIKDIYIEELEAGLTYFIQNVKIIECKNLYQSVNKLLGFMKTNEQILQAYKRVLGILEDKNLITIEKDVVKWNKDE